MPANNLPLSVWIHAGVPIPVSGDSGGQMVSLTIDETTTAQQAIAGTVFSQRSTITGTITATTYQTDTAHGLILGIWQRDRAALGQAPQPGQLTTSGGQTWTYRDSRITTPPAANREEDATTVSTTITVSGLTLVSGAL